MYPEILMAEDWLHKNALFLDTETTGLNDKAEIVQIAILDVNGVSLMDTLVCPTITIPPVATAIHGINDSDVRKSPAFSDLWPKVQEIISGRTVVIYNAEYDLRLMRQSLEANRLDARGLGLVWGMSVDWQDAMILYANFCGEWDDHGNNRWHQLEAACRQMHIDCTGIRAHSAAGDCELTRRLIYALAARRQGAGMSRPTQKYTDAKSTAKNLDILGYADLMPEDLYEVLESLNYFWNGVCRQWYKGLELEPVGETHEAQPQ